MLCCKYCKKEIIKKRSKKAEWSIKHGKQKHVYCSNDCRSLHYKSLCVILTCDNCGNIFERKQKKLLDGLRVFCSKGCFTSFNKNPNSKIGLTSSCLSCNKDILIKKSSRGKFCNTLCQNEFKRKLIIKNWKDGIHDGQSGSRICVTIRKYIFNKYDNKCSKCGWCERSEYTGRIPLQIDHIDGNYLNNKEDNLRLLCPNCHTLTANYGSLNKGHGRPGKINYRQVKYVNEKSIEAWAKGQPPVLGTGHQVGSIPTASKIL